MPRKERQNPMMSKKQKAKVKKVAQGLKKASRSHSTQAKTLSSMLKKGGKGK